MARPDYAATLERHAGEAETLAGSVAAPSLDARADHGTRGHALVEPAAMYGNRWPALYGGFLFDLAYRACALALPALRPLSLELHLLRAVRRADVSERDGLSLAWRVAFSDGVAAPPATPIDRECSRSSSGTWLSRARTASRCSMRVVRHCITRRHQSHTRRAGYHRARRTSSSPPTTPVGRRA